MRARFYVPELGRFLTPDPAGLAGGLNAYAYANNRPLEFTDPLGLWPQLADLERGLGRALGSLKAEGRALRDRVQQGLRLGKQVIEGGAQALLEQAQAARALGLAAANAGRRGGIRWLQQVEKTDQQALVLLIRQGILDPHFDRRHHGSTSTLVNLLQSGANKGAFLLRDLSSGGRALLSDLLAHGLQGEVTRAVGNDFQERFQREQDHVEGLANLLYQDGHGAPSVAFNTTLGYLGEHVGVTPSWEAWRGLAWRPLMQRGEARHLTPLERIQKGLEGGVQALGFAQQVGQLGKGLRGLRRSSPTLAPTPAGGNARGLSGALRGDAAGHVKRVRPRAPGPLAEAAPPARPASLAEASRPARPTSLAEASRPARPTSLGEAARPARPASLAEAARPARSARPRGQRKGSQAARGRGPDLPLGSSQAPRPASGAKGGKRPARSGGAASSREASTARKTARLPRGAAAQARQVNQGPSLGQGGSARGSQARPPVVDPHASWADLERINRQAAGGRRLPGRCTNCVSCALATESTLAGRPASAIPLPHGQRNINTINQTLGTHINDWVKASPDPEVLHRIMTSMGDSRMLVVGSRGAGLPGHAWNGVVRGGQASLLDAQVGGRFPTQALEEFQELYLLRTDELPLYR